LFQRYIYESNHIHISGSVSKTQTQPKGVDIETPGTINGVNVYEFDLDSLQSEEKPWRKPGADITDYFNYGFTEDTWMKYCERQRRLRSDNNAPHLSGPPKSYVRWPRKSMAFYLLFIFIKLCIL
jgi:hypothetical protein